MSQPFLYYLGVYPLFEQQGSVYMPGVMEADTVKAGFPDQLNPCVAY